MWLGGWVGQPKSRGANLTPPPPIITKQRPGSNPRSPQAPAPPPSLSHSPHFLRVMKWASGVDRRPGSGCGPDCTATAPTPTGCGEPAGGAAQSSAGCGEAPAMGAAWVLRGQRRGLRQHLLHLGARADLPPQGGPPQGTPLVAHG